MTTQNNQAEVLKVIKTIYESCIKDIADAERFLRGMRNTLLGQGHIVQQADGFQAIKTVINGGMEITTTMAPWKAARWEKEIAERNAEIVRDGGDKPYRAIHVVDATEQHLERTKQTLESLTSSPYWPLFAEQITQDLTENVNWVGHPIHY